MNRKTIFFLLLFLTSLGLLLSGFNLKRIMFSKEEFPRPHPIQFTDEDFVELAITSFFKYLNQKQFLPTLEYVSMDYTDASGKNFNECKREIKTFIEAKKIQSIDVDYSNFEAFINGDTAFVRCKIKRHSPNNVWEEMTFKLKKKMNVWKIVSFSKFFEILNKNEQNRIEERIGSKGGGK